MELEDDDTDSGWASFLIATGSTDVQVIEWAAQCLPPERLACCAPRSRPQSSSSAPWGLTSGKPTPPVGAEGVGSVEGCSEGFLCVSSLKERGRSSPSTRFLCGEEVVDLPFPS